MIADRCGNGVLMAANSTTSISFCRLFALAHVNCHLATSRPHVVFMTLWGDVWLLRRRRLGAPLLPSLAVAFLVLWRSLKDCFFRGPPPCASSLLRSVQSDGVRSHAELYTAHSEANTMHVEVGQERSSSRC